jgi:hypothetical protein
VAQDLSGFVGEGGGDGQRRAVGGMVERLATRVDIVHLIEVNTDRLERSLT